jgi:cellulose biosynthesis protein BcsQ
MTKIIVFSVRKGGEGKTTLSTNQAGLLSKRGKTLIVDLDQQGHVIRSFGYNPKEINNKNIIDVINNKIDLNEALFNSTHHNKKNLDILASKSELSSFIHEPGGIKRIGNLIRRIAKANTYKYIVIDTAPAFDDLTWELMDLANLVVIPYSCSSYGNEAVSDMIEPESLKNFKLNNEDLKILIVPNRYKLIARKGIESANSKYKIALDDIRNKSGNKDIQISNFISNSDQYDMCVQFEQVPLTLATPSKINRNLKAYEKPLLEQEKLNKFLINL